MSLERVRKEVVELGRLGRREPVAVHRAEGLDPSKGIFRLEGTRQMTDAREFVLGLMRKAGLEIRFDRVGNMFGRRQGRVSARAVMSGSHLDSVANGGQFDGVVGVVGGLEAVRRLAEEGYPHERPIEIAVFFGEEGSAFGRGAIGSAVLAGMLSQADALNLTDENGTSLRETLRWSGHVGDLEMQLADDVACFVELHVEQGSRLYNTRTRIGVVDRVIGSSWLSIVITGQQNHAGTTPMSERTDALVSAADLILQVKRYAETMARQYDGSAVATVGRLKAFPNAPNVLSETVELGVDVREMVDERMEILMNQILDAVSGLGGRYQVSTEAVVRHKFGVADLSPTVVGTIERCACRLRLTTSRIHSHAGHDAMNLARIVPAGMIFIPSQQGISHSPMEWSDWSDIEAGIRVLTETLKDLSRLE